MTKENAIAYASEYWTYKVICKNRTMREQQHKLKDLFIKEYTKGLEDTFYYNISCDWDIDKSLHSLLKQVYGDNYETPYKTFVTVENFDINFLTKKTHDENNWKVIIDGTSYGTDEEFCKWYKPQYRELYFKRWL